MKAISLMYHDVVEGGDWDASGFPGRDAALYKHTRGQFAEHLAAIALSARRAPTVLTDLSRAAGAETPLLITFDDGGRSAHEIVADMLEERGWRGHFFVTAGRVDAPAFLTSAQLRDLRRRGHLVGSHSYSHPTRMSACTGRELLHEWSASISLLSDVLGERVACASVPGGYFSRGVAEAAEASGIEVLFTSEPTARARRIGRCLVLGRYTIQRQTSPREAAALAAGAVAPRLKQVAAWNAKKVAKRVGGERYLRLRKVLLDGR